MIDAESILILVVAYAVCAFFYTLLSPTYSTIHNHLLRYKPKVVNNYAFLSNAFWPLAKVINWYYMRQLLKIPTYVVDSNKWNSE